MKIFLTSLLIILFIPFYVYSSESCYIWGKIVPLTSSCEDIKQILGVKECKFPLSTYKFNEHTIAMTFSDGEDKWNVPKGTVLQVHISLKELIDLKNYLDESKEYLEDYKITPIDDLPDYQIYTYEKKGIELTIIDGKFIQNIVLRPPNKF